MNIKVPLIIYIHGFKSSGIANKAKVLESNFINVLSPTIPYNADLAIHLLDNMIKYLVPYYQITLIGSSLGGFYSIFLSNKYNLKAVLINPCINPGVLIPKYIGQHDNFDGSIFTINQ